MISSSDAPQEQRPYMPPGVPADPEAKPAVPGEIAESVPGGKVLVIEHDIETADFLVTLLENAGYQVDVATDGNYGLMLTDSFEPEVILLAISMPGMGGYEVQSVLRNEPRYAQRFRFTRIFYIADKQPMLQRRFDALPGTPMSDYIFKPIDIPELLDKVAKAIGEKRSESL